MTSLKTLSQLNKNKVKYTTMVLKKAITTMSFNKDMLRYRTRPDLWLEERLGEDAKSILWSAYGGNYDEHKWDGSIDPLYQFWMDIANFRDTGMESGTSTGKTYILARVCLWWMDVFPNPLIVTTSSSSAQMTDGLWSEISVLKQKFKTLRPNSEFLTGLVRKDTEHEKYYKSAQIIARVAQVGAAEKSATKFQGKHRQYMLHVIEEMPGVHPAIVTAIEQTSTGTKNVICAVGNPDNQGDPLHRFIKKKHVKGHRVSAYDHPNVVLGREVIPGAVSIKSIKQRRDTYGADSILYKSRVRGISPKQGQNAIVDWDWMEAISREDFEPDPKHHFGYHAVGVDVARSDFGDMGAVAFGKFNVLTEVYEFQCPSTTHLAYNLIMDGPELIRNGYQDHNIPTIGDYQIYDFCIGIDAVGVGVGTIDTLLDQHPKIAPVSLAGGQLDDAIPKDETRKVGKDEKGQNYYNFNSRRSQMYWELREDIREGRIKFAIVDRHGFRNEKMIDQLMNEIAAHTYELKAGKIVICEKDEVKQLLGGKSPNVSDAVAYWNHVRKGWYKNRTYAPVSSGG